jgi:hypothetical protein
LNIEVPVVFRSVSESILKKKDQSVNRSDGPPGAWTEQPNRFAAGWFNGAGFVRAHLSSYFVDKVFGHALIIPMIDFARTFVMKSCENPRLIITHTG